MTKEQFLNELKEKLKSLPKNEIEERINFYSEMIDDRIDEGKSEEEAIKEIGTVDEIIKEIASDTPLVSIVKEKIKPKRKLRAWEILFLILGFPLWFPLTLVALLLILVAYLIIWIFVIAIYAIEIALIASFVMGIISFILYAADNNMNVMPLAVGFIAGGLAILLFHLCIIITKKTAKFAKKIVVGIKTAFIRKGE